MVQGSHPQLQSQSYSHKLNFHLYLLIISIHSSNPNVLHPYLVLNFVWQRKKCKPATSTIAMATDATRKAILYLCICLPNGLCVSVTRSVKTPLSDILDLPL